MPIITITVTGLKECEAALNKAKLNLPNQTRLTLEDLASLFIREAKANAHVITGNMKRQIGMGAMSTNSVEVNANAEYSKYENDRPGTKGGTPHNFMDTAAVTTEQVGTKIVKQRMDDLFSSAGMPVQRGI